MRWIAWLLLAACSSGSPSPRPEPPRPAASDPAQLVPAGPTDRECDELITHAVMLGIDEERAGPRSTEADHEAVRRELHEDFMAGCRTLSRSAYRCAIATTTLAELAACQPTRSSSTSNSSVAPGGIAPPAPRSP